MPSRGRARIILGLTLFSAAPVLGQNQVLDLDGQDSYVELPSHIFQDFEEATIEGWVKFHEFRTESRFFDFGTRGPGIYVTEIEATSTLKFVVQDQAEIQPRQQNITIENALRLNQWCHLAAVTGRSGMQLYLNGALVGTNTYSGSFRSLRNDRKAVRNYLGRNNWRGSYRTADFSGQMDEIRVWSTARTAEEIRAHLFQRLTGSEPGLAGLWNFDDGTARDRSASQHHGTLAATPDVFPPTSPRPAN